MVLHGSFVHQLRHQILLHIERPRANQIFFLQKTACNFSGHCAEEMIRSELCVIAVKGGELRVHEAAHIKNSGNRRGGCSESIRAQAP